jgi:translation initiation factor 1
MRARTSDESTLVYSSTDTTPTRTSRSAPTPDAPTPRGSRTSGQDGVRIWLEKKGRNGTPVSIVRGLTSDRDALAVLAARLKRACGSGGSAKDGEIIIQGDHRERIAALLTADGLRVKLAGG